MKQQFQQIIFVLIILFFTSCRRDEKEDDYIFKDIRFENIDKLSINQIIKIENEIGSKERTENNTFALDTSYYPNKNRFALSNPKVFERNQTELGLETDYFYTNNDGLIKVVLYEWKAKYWNLNGYKSDTLKKQSISQINIYKNKFNNLKKEIIRKLGKPTQINIEKHSDTISNYIDNYEWKKNDLNISLSLFYGDDTFNQIRLAIHKE
jgi:hypothetical protein